ncbi:MAG: hypothetical protein HZB91_00190 [Elusimicrobia bacterium]|nr:hypothetical protein [Elusimicrobiota bacterium]
MLRASSLQRVTLRLLLVSFTILFQELLLIRWLGQQVRILAYFPNIILISAFLGIGLGCLRSGKRDVFGLWPLGLLSLMAAMVPMSRVVFTRETLSEHLWLLYGDLPANAPVIRDVFFPIAGTFLLSTLCFIPLGQILADSLTEAQRLRSALWGYTWDIIGSSMGVASFTLISFLRAGPVVWFLILGGCVVLLMARRSGLLMVVGVCATLAGGARYLDRADLYSPYYAISVKPVPAETRTGILVNGSLHQYAMPLRSSDSDVGLYSQVARDGYHLPYRLLSRKPRNVLVLGAGTGNDVAVALDEGAGSVDVVEIDPIILGLGKSVHPDKPYQSDRVHLFNTDARSFLNTTRSSYDLIIFGTLDSLTKLSALSNVRLDNFVYTQECFKAARRHLTPDGGVVLYFMVGKGYLGERLAGMLTVVFGEFPLIVKRYCNVFNAIFMVGPAFESSGGAVRREVAHSLSPSQLSSVLPSDDWPFLYLKDRSIGRFYLQMGGFILLLSVAGIFGFSDRLRESVRNIRSVDWEMILFGTAFLLLEIRGIITMNLLWGATWFTNAVVIQAIFLVILLGIGGTASRRMSFKSAVAGLVMSLLAVYVCPLENLLSTDPLVKGLVSILLVGMPILFASIAFSVAYSRREEPALAFGWNLLGAVIGGLLEFLSMVLGLRNLVLLALACYLCASWAHIRSDHAAGRTPLRS